ncbi:MAG TPA: hypothetical protein VMV06_12195 [Acidimicrobiales bacterium]|nr:hypothetical protein [Acidimicrobiales bacterium]
MNHPIPSGRKIVAGAVALVAISLGTAGLAWAAPASVPAVPRSARHFDCANATKALTRIEKLQADVAAGLPKLNAVAAKAQRHGNTKRADRLKKRIARFEGARYKTRLARTASAIEAKCHVPAPGATTGLATGSVART